MARARGTRDRYDYGATLGGVLFIAAFTLIAMAAVNTQWALLFIIFGLMLGAFLLSVVVSRRMLSAVEVERDMPARAFANQVVHLGYCLRHQRKGPPALGLEISELRGPQTRCTAFGVPCPPPHLQSLAAYCLHLPALAMFRSGSRLWVSRRGRYRFSWLRLATRFPFGLINARRDMSRPFELVVWPALGRLRQAVLVGGATELSDAAPSQARSGSDEFFGLREYRQGDNPRWIHWRRSAGTGALVVREMSKPLPDVLYIVLDTHLPDPSPQAVERRERLVRFAATLAEHWFHRDYHVGLALACADRVVALAPRAGRGPRQALLDALADVDDNRQLDLSALLAQVPRAHVRHAQVVVVAPDDARLGGLDRLAAACRRLVAVTDATLAEHFEDAPPPPEPPARRPSFRLWRRRGRAAPAGEGA